MRASRCGELSTIHEIPLAERAGRVLALRVPLLAVVSLLTAGTALADAAFLVTPTRFDFGEIQLGNTSPEQVATLTNVSAAPLRVQARGGATTDPSFTGLQNCWAVTLAPGQSCQFVYSFTPQAQ